ncbi:unnamed protein product [Clonostachys byssicola]|uniref:Protein kinase domain-containing protein n=1 Tax=Clonostachys byssicola TaxID=160290 RepID=A0A9N9Y4F3_9HYPO|nr:unnamed protein product [Clonostachys byssicola]
MLIWLDGLNMPQPEEWGDPVAAFMLSKLKDSRTANSGNRRDDHFARNPYFTSDSEASTQDGHFSGNPYFASESEASTRDSQREGSQTEEDEFDETIRPDDLVTQVPDKISQPANEDSSTIKPAVNGSVGSDNSLRTEVSHEPHSSSLSASTPSGPFDIFRPATPDLVRDSKLETVITNNGALVQHITYEPNHYVHQRRLRKKQTWKRVRELGRGGSGCVWLEERLDGHDNGGTFRAVKEIFKIQPPGQHLSINYDRELEAIAKFPHSKVTYFSFFSLFLSFYSLFPSPILVPMEYMKHGNLEGYLSRPFHEEETKQIVFQLLEGLHFMHDEGFAHRNLNPANILVAEPSPHWWVKIGDIGISKRAEEETTAFHTMVGYLAPEVMGFCSAEDVIGVRSAGKDSSSMYTVAVDIWALGVIMFRLLNNRNVFGNYGQLTQSIPPDDLPRKKMSVNDEDTAPSAD